LSRSLGQICIWIGRLTSAFGLVCLSACSQGGGTHFVYVHDGQTGGVKPSGIQGTADGSGAGLRKSSNEDIDRIIINPEEDQLSLKRRLRLMFHRMVFLRQKPTPKGFTKADAGDLNELVHAYLTTYSGSESDLKDPPVFKVLDKMFAKQEHSLQEDLESLVIKAQDAPCISYDGQKKLMAIKEHTICVSREMSSFTAPENLLIQTLAVGAHEVAHLRKVMNEDEAEMVRQYVIDNQDFLIKGNSLSDLVEMERYLSTGLLETAVRYPEDRVLQKEERCLRLLQSLERLGALPGVLIGVENRPTLENSISRYCMDIDQSVLPRQAAGGAAQSRDEILELTANSLQMVEQLESRRRQFMSIYSPFFSWRYQIYDSAVADQILVSNVLNSLLDKNGVWKTLLSDAAGARLRAGLRCTVAGQPITFSQAQCPAMKSDDAESYPLVVRDYTLDEKTCALVKHKDSKGFEHQILFISGPHTIDEDGKINEMRHMKLNELVNLQILMNLNQSSENLRNVYWREAFKKGIFIPNITGDNLLSARNNVTVAIEPFDDFRPPEYMPLTWAQISAVLHPVSAPQIHFQLHLASDYDGFWEKIIYDSEGVDVHCQLSPAVN
jgi:hypothetical protein